ncbi:myotubularin-related protein 10-B [Nilaparvata lugens]|uniref:myotubularin-related protein 10-B n=1 Tax=Nilaparvata lugens TaxID=108931 RepID=UPI00193E650D|nr:myotubularin-related protein 10-B [Nilaparvata lugens]
MNDKRMTNSFKSYVELDDESFSTSMEDSFCDNLSPRILPGEMVIAEANYVLMFAPVSQHKHGKSGTLTVTNFKLSFVTADDKQKEDMISQENLLLGENDVCLSNVDVLYLVGDKKKRLIPGKNISERVKGLHVVCKNMRTMTFSFKFSPVGHGKTLTNALLHHAFPRRHQLLYAYDFSQLMKNAKRDTSMFREAGEWGRELARTGCVGWRLTGVNHDFQLSNSLPQWLVVPSSVLDWQLSEAARHFRLGRAPLWCWSNAHGAALVRMADLLPTITDRVKENIMLETVRKSHPLLSTPVVMELSKSLPSTKDIQTSFLKLRELCAPESEKQFWVQDNNFLSLMENTRWLHTVSACLSKAVETSRLLHRDITVVLQEADGRDLCPLIGSLVQLMLDPHLRTIQGFQSLVQREWVIMGHPFCTRLGHVYSTDGEQSPVFLVFLDCVWQLLQQFPTEFQMSETYLTTLWDSVFFSTFDTFLFDCERDRLLAAAEPNNPLTLRPVWDWGEQFLDRDVMLFSNPLYVHPPTSATPVPLPASSRLPVLQLWSQCYFRFIPLLEIVGGGNPQIDLSSRLLLSQIDTIEETSEAAGGVGGGGVGPPPQAPLESLSKIGSFFPFSRRSDGGHVSAALLVSSLSLNQSFHSTEIMLDSQSILNAPD